MEAYYNTFIYPEEVTRIPYQEWLTFLQSNYPQSARCPFTPEVDTARKIPTDPSLPPATIFYAHARGADINVPVPLHPKLDESGFYSQFAYLMDKATPFVDYPGLEMLQSDNVTRDFQARSQTARRIRQALGKGKCVVVHACTTSYDEQFRDPNDLTFGPLISYPDQTVQPQNLTKYPSSLSVPAQTFLDSRNDPGVVWNVIDLHSYGRYEQPPWIRFLYDDKPAIRQLLADGPFTSADLPRLGSWALFGHAGSHTFCHQDAGGFLTHVRVQFGRKLWYVLEWIKPPEPRHWLARCQLMDDLEFFALEYEEKPPWIEGEGNEARVSVSSYKKNHAEWESRRVARWRVAELTPGTTLIMPPGQPHWVYNSETTLSIGGHGLVWEAIPLTEVGCRMCSFGYFLTNTSHPSARQIHESLFNTLPLNPAVARDRFGRSDDELRSLLRLVLRHQNYHYNGTGREFAQPPPSSIHAQVQTKIQTYSTTLNITIPRHITTISRANPADFAWAPKDSLYISQ